MAFLDHNGESEFPLPRDQVFDALCKAVPTIKGMKIDYADKLQGRIMVKSGVSLYSWGENIPIQLTTIDNNRTKVQITSSPKTGIMFGGAFDMGKNRKNIENILATTSQILSSQQTNNSTTDDTNSNNFNQSNNLITNQNPNIMEQTKTEKPWYKKTWVIVLGVIFLLIVIANMGKDKDAGTSSSTASSESSSEPAKEKQWTEVYTFKGSGMKKSPVFELTGAPARLKYKYNSGSNMGMGMFAVYVVDEGDDIMKTGGIPEIMTQEENEESESSIQKGSGSYYLNVNAQGKWEVVVEEKK